MAEISIETLLTVTGITLVTSVFVQATKVLLSSLSDTWVRRLALIYGVTLALVVASFSPAEPGVAPPLFFLVAGVNGVIAGLAAMAGYESFRYGNDRVVMGADIGGE